MLLSYDKCASKHGSTQRSKKDIESEQLGQIQPETCADISTTPKETVSSQYERAKEALIATFYDGL